MIKPITKKSLLFAFLLFCGVILLSPHLYFQRYLSSGDHGLQLYAAERVLLNEKPYHDFHWFYGPLMPYYYAFFFKLFGIGIPSAMLGNAFALLLCGIAVYGMLRTVASPIIAVTASLWLWIFYSGFYYTYNHIGGVVCMLFSLWAYVAYIRHEKTPYAYIGLAFLGLLAFIKLNIGFSSLAAYMLSLWLADHIKQWPLRQKHIGIYLTGGLILPMLILGLHWLMLKDLPFYVLSQCFQYFGNDAYANDYAGLGATLWALLQDIRLQITISWPSMALSAVVFVNLFSILIQVRKDRLRPRSQKILFLSLMATLLFYFFNNHEYLLSGVVYRGLWVDPLRYLLIFLVIAWGTAAVAKRLMVLLSLSILLVGILSHTSQLEAINRFLVPQHYLSLPRAGIFISNEPAWIKTLLETDHYLRKNIPEDEKFLAVPYEPLLYFLLGRKSPTRQLVFFEFQNMPPEQERSIIQELEAENTRWVVLSNRIRSHEAGLGTFGQTHCPLLSDYIKTHFEAQASFGNWERYGGWCWDFATKVLKKTMN